MAIEDDLKDLKSRLELREKQIIDINKKNNDLSNKILDLDKRSKVKHVILKEVPTSLTKTVFTEVIKAGTILLVTMYLNKMLSKEAIEKSVKKEVKRVK